MAAGGAAVLIAVVIGVWFALGDRTSSESATAAPTQAGGPATAAVSISSESAPPTTVTEEPPIVPVAPIPPPTVASPARGDLQLPTRMTVPACDGTGIVVLYSATNPASYSTEVAALLASNPGAQYLRTDNACSSLRQQTSDGNAIYAVYRPAGPTDQLVCSAVDAAGGDAYGKWLDATTDPSYIIPC